MFVVVDRKKLAADIMDRIVREHPDVSELSDSDREKIKTVIEALVLDKAVMNYAIGICRIFAPSDIYECIKNVTYLRIRNTIEEYIYNLRRESTHQKIEAPIMIPIRSVQPSPSTK